MKGAGGKNSWALFLLLLTGIVLGGFQIMVEVAAAQDVITCLIFFLHVFGKHRDLSFADRVAVAVSGHVEFKNHQFFSVIHRNSGDAVAAVQIKKLTERSGHRKTSSQRIRHRISGKQRKPGFTAAMRLCKWIKQKCRIIILCKYAVIILSLIHI